MRITPKLLLIALSVTLPWPQNCFADSVPPKQPTAFDYFQSASAAEVDGHKIDFANSTIHGSTDPDDREYTEAEKEALVKENAEALKLLRQGLTLPYQNPPPDSLDTMFPYYAKDRALARLLSLTGKTQAAQGQWGEAVNTDLDAVQLGTELPHGSILIGTLVGLACQAIGRRPIWDNINHLNATQAKAAALRLQEIQKRQISYADMMVTEKSSFQTLLQKLIQQPDWRGTIKIFVQKGADVQGIPFTWTAQQEAEVQQLDGQAFVADHAQYMDQLIQAARLPYANGPNEPVPPRYNATRFFSPDTTHVRVKFVNNQAQNRMLIAAFALRAYRAEHGAYPAKLSALVPSDLTSIPSDPFTLSGQLCYKPSNPGYLLYSVGPDGKDDGGQPISDTTQPSPHMVTDDSAGDVVGGINF